MQTECNENKNPRWTRKFCGNFINFLWSTSSRSQAYLSALWIIKLSFGEKFFHFKWTWKNSPKGMFFLLSHVAWQKRVRESLNCCWNFSPQKAIPCALLPLDVTWVQAEKISRAYAVSQENPFQYFWLLFCAFRGRFKASSLWDSVRIRCKCHFRKML